MFVAKSARLVVSRSNQELLKRCFSKSTSNFDALTGARQNNGSSKLELSRFTSMSKYNTNRSLSTQHILPGSSNPAALDSEENMRQLLAVWPDIVRDLTDASRTRVDIPEDVRLWFARVLEYNIPQGKKVRSLSAVLAYKMLADPKDLTPENIRLINILGWCLEICQSYFLITDDVVDSSDLRRGIPCWHKVPGVGLLAVFDSILVNTGVHSLLHKHFLNHPAYIPLLRVFDEFTLRTAVGQTLDALSMKDGKPNLDIFTMQRYNDIVENKTSFYSFECPASVGIYFAGVNDPELHAHAKKIAIKMGLFFQVRDDFLDCFGDTSITGKKGVDIREGRCSWLVTLALERATPAQRKLLDEHYGRVEPASTQLIKDLYTELGLQEEYPIHQENLVEQIKNDIQQIANPKAQKLFTKYMERLNQPGRQF